MAWAVRQSGGNTRSGSGTTIAVTLGTTPVAGNKIIVVVTCAGALTTVTGVADSNAVALTSGMTALTNSSGHTTTYLFFYDVPATPSTTITATFNSGTQDGAMWVGEVSGLMPGNTTACLDGTPGTTPNGSTSPTASSTYSSTDTNHFLMAFFSDWGQSATVTQPSGYTLDAGSVNTNAIDDMVVAYKNSVGGVESNVFTYTTTGNFWVTGMVAFKSLPAGQAVVQATSIGLFPGAVTSLNVPVPTGAAIGDVVEVFLYRQETSSTLVTMPSGFVLKTQVNATAGTTRNTLSVMYKRLTAADTGNYAFSWTAAENCEASALLIRGATKSGDPFDAFVTAIANSATTPSVNVTTTMINELCVWHSTNGGGQPSNPTGWTSQVTTGNDNQTSSKLFAAKGATGAITAAGGATDAEVAFLGAIISDNTVTGAVSVIPNVNMAVQRN